MEGEGLVEEEYRQGTGATNMTKQAVATPHLEHAHNSDEVEDEEAEEWMAEWEEYVSEFRPVMTLPCSPSRYPAD